MFPFRVQGPDPQVLGQLEIHKEDGHDEEVVLRFDANVLAIFTGLAALRK